MIPLIKNTFYNELKTKADLSDFILTTSQLSMGKQVQLFEATFGAIQNRKHAICFNSGASANLALLQALKSGKTFLEKMITGKKGERLRVGFSALTWATNVMPIIQMGWTPVPIDVEIETLNISSRTLKNAMKKCKLDMLFITNALGLTGDLPEISKICRTRNVVLIEDNCESIGTTYALGQRTGNFGLASTFSFFVAHQISTIEGGMVCTDDDHLATLLRLIRANGWDRNVPDSIKGEYRAKHDVDDFHAKYTFYTLAYNMRPTEITGFLGLSQLAYLRDIVTIRECNFRYFHRELFSRIPRNKRICSFFRLKFDHLRRISSFALPVICHSERIRDLCLNRLAKAEIETRPIIAGNMKKQPFFIENSINGTGTVNIATPNANMVHDRGFYVGNNPDMTIDDIDEIIKNLIWEL